MNYHQSGGTISSEAVLRLVESNAYDYINQHFTNVVPNQIGGGGKTSVVSLAKQIQKNFENYMASGGSCDSTQSVIKPPSQGAPPFELPQSPGGYVGTVSGMPEIPVAAYNANLYSI